MSIIVVVTSFIFRQVKSKKCNKSHDLMQHVQMVKDELWETSNPKNEQ